MKIRAGDWVEVRSKEEILRTLDQNGRLDELPFMPQMLQYCGQMFKVYKRAHKTCDTATRTGGRRLSSAVHLDLRCNGEAYGGCQAACLIFWREAWLKPVSKERNSGESTVRVESRQMDIESVAEARCSEQDLWKGTRCSDDRSGETRYVCQATQVPFFTTPLPWWDVRQFLEDYRSGNATLRRMLRGFVYFTYFYLTQAGRNRVGRPARWIYDRFQDLWGGLRFPRRIGTFPNGQRAPACDLNLQPGELVRVKSHQEILATVHPGGLNRGLLFDGEMVPYCGGVYRVKRRVDKFINESTGKMTSLKTPAVILEDVWCRARYTSCRMYCPRSIYSWWREIWLERVPEGTERRSAGTREV